MKKSIATLVAAAALALPGTAAEAVTPSQQASATARIYAPLTIAWVQNLDFGALALGSGTWANQVISMDQAGGLTGCTGNVTCSGAPQPAKYRLTGTNNATVQITSPGFNLQQGSLNIAFTPNAPGTVNLGGTGTTVFGIGGSISLSSTTATGTYTGNFLVTADYQ